MQTPETIKTTCPYCGVGCGILARVDENGTVTVKGDPEHPANFGRLCSKGTALPETVSLEDRLLYPEIMGEQVSWEQAINTVAGRFQEIIAEHGKDAVAFYVSGQLLTEDYYVANKLMKGFIGSGNIDTNSRLCMSSPVVAHKRAFGEDLVPCSYEDLERAKLIVIVGSNTAWCHPVIYQRIVKAKKDNPDLMLVVIDPRKTQTAQLADLHLAIEPGMDALLFTGLLNYLDKQGERNNLFVNLCTQGAEEALTLARHYAANIKQVAQGCGLSIENVERFFRLFARTERVVTLFSQGVNQSSSGVDKGNAIINCHLLSGRIGRPGMGPFSLTGQPNAMGGREVGGLANQLAAHMEIENAEHRNLVQDFWQSPTITETQGYKAVDLFGQIHAGKVKAVWIIATNPVVSLPQADRVREALQRCELVVVSDCVRQTDTTELAHICLPASTWGERDGTVTNSERRISRQRSFLLSPGQVRPDWWIITSVAQAMGYAKAFNYRHPADIFSEHASLSAYKNTANTQRAFDISALAQLKRADYNALEPIQWPVNAQKPEGSARLFDNSRFFTAQRKAHLIAIQPQAPQQQTTADYPYRLNSGRVRDQWHTMTRTGYSSRLSLHRSQPFVEIHPDDAFKHGLLDGELAQVTSPQGTIIVRVRYSDAQQSGSLFVPMHWNGQFSRQARVGSLFDAIIDPLSGQPEFKHGCANIKVYTPTWQGFLLSRRRLAMHSATSYWSRSRLQGLWLYEIAGEQEAQQWDHYARTLLCSEEAGVNWIEYFDTSQTQYRAARFTKDRLESCIFIAPNRIQNAQEWLPSLFDKTSLSKTERAHLLSGQPLKPQADVGRIVCACFSVGEKTILEAIEKQGLDSVEGIGRCLQAGTNCGSCIPELEGMLHENR